MLRHFIQITEQIMIFGVNYQDIYYNVGVCMYSEYLGRLGK